MININKYLSRIKPYKVASHKIWRVTPEERQSILKLDWNEATCEPSSVVKQRLLHLLDTDFINFYPDTNNQEIYQKLSEYLNLPVDNIQYFGSSDYLHEYLSRIYVDSGDEVLIVWPSYDNLRLTMQSSGANINFFELGEHFTFDFEAFEKEIERLRPKLVYICNPNNPTGTLIDKEYIKFLITKFPETTFLIDEAYIEFSETDTCKEFVRDFDNILITRTLSKAFGLANIRFGYILASAENIQAISNIRNPKNITTFAQEAAIGALSDISHMRSYVAEVIKARDFFIDFINNNFSGRLMAYPSHGNFVLIDCLDIQTKSDLLKYLEDNNIFIRAVSQSESLKNCVRITIGKMHQMKIVANCIDKFFARK